MNTNKKTDLKALRPLRNPLRALREIFNHGGLGGHRVGSNIKKELPRRYKVTQIKKPI